MDWLALPPCFGTFDSADLTCNGDPLGKTVVEASPCAVRLGCLSISTYCRTFRLKLTDLLRVGSSATRALDAKRCRQACSVIQAIKGIREAHGVLVTGKYPQGGNALLAVWEAALEAGTGLSICRPPQAVRARQLYRLPVSRGHSYWHERPWDTRAEGRRHFAKLDHSPRRQTVNIHAFCTLEDICGAVGRDVVTHLNGVEGYSHALPSLFRGLREDRLGSLAEALGILVRDKHNGEFYNNKGDYNG